MYRIPALIDNAIKKQFDILKSAILPTTIQILSPPADSNTTIIDVDLVIDLGIDIDNKNTSRMIFKNRKESLISLLSVFLNYYVVQSTASMRKVSIYNLLKKIITLLYVYIIYNIYL